MNILSEILKFIKEKFDSMPEWLRVTTFIFFVVGFFALIFSPKYIDVRLVGIVGTDEFPLPEARIEIETEDRVITLVSDSTGRFSVPIGLANPIKNYTFVLYPEVKSKRQLDIDVSGHKAFTDWNKLRYSREEDKYEFASYIRMPFFNIASAQENISEFRALDNIDDVVIDAISKTTGLKHDDINMHANLQDELSLNNYDLSYVTHRVNTEFGIDAWTKIWDNAKSPKDIVDISRTLFYQDRPWGNHLVNRNRNVKQLLEDAKNRYPEDVYTKFVTARTLRKSKKIPESLAIFDSILSENPDFYLAQYNKALALVETSEKDKAIESFKKSIEIQRKEKFTDASVYNSYGRYLYKNGNYMESLKQYQIVKEIDPDRAFIDDYIDESLSELGCQSLEQCIQNGQN